MPAYGLMTNVPVSFYKYYAVDVMLLSLGIEDGRQTVRIGKNLIFEFLFKSSKYNRGHKFAHIALQFCKVPNN